MRECVAASGSARPWQTRLQRSCGDRAAIVPALLDCPSLLHPDFQLLPPPVVVIGMHRSGTSLAAALLAAVGVYMGPE